MFSDDLTHYTTLLRQSVFKLCRTMKADWNFQDVLRQCINSVTSVGANIAEAKSAESAKDFIHKLSIARKELYETQYWITVFQEYGIESQTTEEAKQISVRVLKILHSCIKTAKSNLST